MPTFIACIVVGVAGLVVWGTIGFALARKVIPATLALPLAPIIGWACDSALALPFYCIVGMTRSSVSAVIIVPFAAALASIALHRSDCKRHGKLPRVPPLAYGFAVLLAVVPALAVTPKLTGEAVTLAAPIFDHSKIALIDDIIRLGVPPGNPFFGEVGGESQVAYYYLWHFSAAELAIPFGATGWEADIALTGFTAVASLLLMSGFAVWISDRSEAGFYVVPLAFAASLHPVLAFLLGPEAFYSIFLPPTGLAGWLFQTSWATQHIAATSCVVLSCFLLPRLAHSPSLLNAAVLAAVVAAGYESSIWVGCILFGFVSPVIVVLLLTQCAWGQRMRVAALFGIAAAAALLLAYPFVKSQIAVAAAREVARPIAFLPYEVFNIWVPDRLRSVLNVPGYWLALLPIEFPAIYLPGLISLAGTLCTPSLTPLVRDGTRTFAVLTAASLFVTGYLTTTFADNNDLGWRAVLPGVFVLTIFTAGGFARRLSTPRPLMAAGTLLLFALSLPKSIELLSENAKGAESPSDATFAHASEMWAAVRRYTAPAERVGNNPAFMAEMTPWPVNISWALFADRRSCFAGHELAVAFAPLSRARETDISRQFHRVFDGQPETNDVRDLAAQLRCRVIVVTPQDGAWARDPFAGSGFYKLVEDRPDRWRIYRALDPPSVEEGN